MYDSVFFNTVIIRIVSGCALLMLFLLFFKLSKRLGEALQMKKYYHLFTLGSVFVLSSLVVQLYILLNCTTTNFQIHQFIDLSYLFLALGVTFSFIAALKYWGWLLKEIIH